MSSSDKKRRLASALMTALKERRSLTAGEVMTVAPTCISPETSALDVVKLYHEHGFRHLLVVDDEGILRGVISDRDVISCFGPTGRQGPDNLENILASELMSSDVISIEPTTPINEALQTMLENGINALPVLHEGALQGILTSTDMYHILGHLLESLPSALPV
jgi:acetoin utilization protein AcuB